MIKIYHAQGWNHYSNWIPNRKIVRSLEEADLLLLEGGTDVNATMYGEKRHVNAEFPDVKRDKMEAAMFNEAVKLGIPILGICRGSQLICVMNGGKLVQDQQNRYNHDMQTLQGVVPVNSTHHQAQFPYNLTTDKYKLLGWTEAQSKFHHGGEHEEMINGKHKEAEVVYYPKTRALGIQFHPETLWDAKNAKPDEKMYESTFAFVNELLEKLMNNTL